MKALRRHLREAPATAAEPWFNIQLYPWQHAAINSPFQHTAFYGGVAAGKTYTGSQFAILNMVCHPEKTGLIGANTYDQLTQATLRELFYWLEAYNLDYVIDRIPPQDWGVPRQFKSYRNILSVKIRTGEVATALIRVMSNPDALRGVEISWYWLDELRDTEQYAHDMVLGRMRESGYARGLATTTTNGEGWDYQRFVLGGLRQDGIYGSLHVPTIEIVKAGQISESYYRTMRATYSELMAAQELDAKHVNVGGGRAYYSEGDYNRQAAAPWGDYHPDPARPLVVGCDFNFSPAPLVWVIGQVGPPPYEEHFHVFGELQATETSTRQMGRLLLSRYPGFFYSIFGDASGRRGTTSNAGETDYQQLGQELDENGAPFTVDVDPSNPLVKDRVENVNARLHNALGETFLTYDPQRAPLLAGDFKNVGWKPMTGSRVQGKLDDGGDKQRTHASDGLGYALYRLFPPGRRLQIVQSVPSNMRPLEEERARW